MSLRVWFFFVVTETVLCLTPGPAVLFILSCGLARGGRAALWGNAGILSANTFYFVVSAFGLGAASTLALLVAALEVSVAAIPLVRGVDPPARLQFAQTLPRVW